MSNPFASHSSTQSSQGSVGTNTSSSSNTQSFANPLAQGFQNQMMQNVNQMYNQAQTPLYGQGQIAQNLQGLNQLANSSIKNLQGQLARTGGMQGGGQAQGISNILQNKGNQAFNFTSQLPMLNQQAKMAGEGQAIGLGNQLQSQFLRNTSQTGNAYSSNTGSGSSQTTSDPSIMSDIGQSIGIAGGIAGGLNNLMGGNNGASPDYTGSYDNGQPPSMGIMQTPYGDGASMSPIGGMASQTPWWMTSQFPGYPNANTQP